MKEVPTPTFPFSLIHLPMGALPPGASHNRQLVASIKDYWQRLRHRFVGSAAVGEDRLH